MKILKRLLPLGLALALLAGCAHTGSTEPAPAEAIDVEHAYVDQVVMEDLQIENEAVALSSSPAALGSALLPVASGTAVEQNSRAVIDYSNIKDGYVMVKFTGTTNTRLKVQVLGPSYATTQLVYYYDLPVGQWATFPLSDGNGAYKVSVMENTTGTKYALVLSASFTAAMTDEFAPYLRPNQYVDYSVATNTVAKAKELAGSETDALKLVEIIYNFVTSHMTYDTQLAATVKSGYLPVLDNALATGKGICFDYASLMTGMLRSLGVPCKLVIGYAGEQYHAWISVWSAETGWIDGAIYFDGNAWQRMDPTFASSSNGSEAILQYIGDGKNYNMKYAY
ncbi:MAG: transglutaminase domain-containing protein [Oscillospiraceae bacterium]|nr:transglutaminase domain-containing protein [Oscillospiraceae bacterium]